MTIAVDLDVKQQNKQTKSAKHSLVGKDTQTALSWTHKLKSQKQYRYPTKFKKLWHNDSVTCSGPR